MTMRGWLSEFLFEAPKPPGTDYLVVGGPYVKIKAGHLVCQEIRHNLTKPASEPANQPVNLGEFGKGLRQCAATQM